MLPGATEGMTCLEAILDKKWRVAKTLEHRIDEAGVTQIRKTGHLDFLKFLTQLVTSLTQVFNFAFGDHVVPSVSSAEIILLIALIFHLFI